MISYAPVPIRIALAGHPVPRRFLGQPEAPFRVVVTDPRGIPFVDATVLIGSQAGKTDSRGIAVFAPGSLSQEVRTSGGRQTVPARIVIGNLVIAAEGSIDQTLFVQVPICAPQPFLTTPELLSFAAGSVLVGAGLYWKVNPLKIVGEILFGAAVFTAVYRHSCSA